LPGMTARSTTKQTADALCEDGRLCRGWRREAGRSKQPTPFARTATKPATRQRPSLRLDAKFGACRAGLVGS